MRLRADTTSASDWIIVGMFLLAALVALHLPAVSPTAPNRQPQLAAAGGTVALVFGSGGRHLARTQSLDNGRNFGAPSKVAELPKMLLGRHRGPRVVHQRQRHRGERDREANRAT